MISQIEIGRLEIAVRHALGGAKAALADVIESLEDRSALFGACFSPKSEGQEPVDDLLRLVTKQWRIQFSLCGWNSFWERQSLKSWNEAVTRSPRIG